MAEIRWTEEAATWLEDIHKFISQDNPIAADQVVERIYEKVQILNKFPEIGYQFRATREGDIRVLLYGHYRIAYLLDNHKTILILGIFHSALEIDRYL
jgi:plasmid stabilization system protein ParE